MNKNITKNLEFTVSYFFPVYAFNIRITNDSLPLLHFVIEHLIQILL